MIVPSKACSASCRASCAGISRWLVGSSSSSRFALTCDKRASASRLRSPPLNARTGLNTSSPRKRKRARVSRACGDQHLLVRQSALPARCAPSPARPAPGQSNPRPGWPPGEPRPPVAPARPSACAKTWSCPSHCRRSGRTMRRSSSMSSRFKERTLRIPNLQSLRAQDDVAPAPRARQAHLETVLARVRILEGLDVPLCFGPRSTLSRRSRPRRHLAPVLCRICAPPCSTALTIRQPAQTSLRLTGRAGTGDVSLDKVQVLEKPLLGGLELDVAPRHRSSRCSR